jgi:acyl-CoA reductase-like NAD-dependent aldehyde dehydrogenase
VLELGGNAAAIVCADAALERAAQRLAIGAFTSAGQVCIKVQRIVVEAAVWAPFLERFLAHVRALEVGDPAREGTVVGPVIDDAAAARIGQWVDEAVAAGATPLLSGKREGRLLSPTVLTDVPRTVKAYREELFGPVVLLEKVADFEQALAAVNDSAYGLQAAVFTNRLDRVREAFHALEVGGVVVNDAPSFRSDNQPYGGVKGSGLGREGVRYAMEDFTEERVLIYRP